MKIILFFILFFTQAGFSKEKSSSQKNLLFSLENSFALTHNKLLDSWSVEIPTTEIGLSYPFSTKALMSVEIDISYQQGDWTYSMDHFALHQQLFKSSQLQWGYFDYPVSYVVENENLFSKKILTHTSLFPKGDKTLGILSKNYLAPDFYLKGSLQSPIYIRKTDRVGNFNPSPAVTVTLSYEKTQRKFFLSYFQQKFFLEGIAHSVGGGSNLVFKINSLVLGFRGEFWRLKKNRPPETILTYYANSYLKWKQLALQALYGRSQTELQSNSSLLEEYIISLSFNVTKKMELKIEYLQEQDSIIKKQASILSLRTKF